MADVYRYNLLHFKQFSVIDACLIVLCWLKMFFFVPDISSDVLALPIFKQEESSLPSDNENKILPFQYVLCASTSPAVKLHEETLTYLNQGTYWAPTLCLALVFAFFLNCSYK